MTKNYMDSKPVGWRATLGKRVAVKAVGLGLFAIHWMSGKEPESARNTACDGSSGILGK